MDEKRLEALRSYALDAIDWTAQGQSYHFGRLGEALVETLDALKHLEAQLQAERERAAVVEAAVLDHYEQQDNDASGEPYCAFCGKYTRYPHHPTCVMPSLLAKAALIGVANEQGTGEPQPAVDSGV